MTEQLLTSKLAATHPHWPGSANSQAPSNVSDGYTVSREQAEVYNQFMQPKVGPGRCPRSLALSLSL